MSELRTHDSNKKRKLSSTDIESTNFENDPNDDAEKIQLKRSPCRITSSSTVETEEQSKIEDEEYRKNSLSSPSKQQITGHSSSTDLYQSSDSTSFYSCKDKPTSSNLQHNMDTNYPLSINENVLDDFSCNNKKRKLSSTSRPITPNLSNATSHISNKPCSSIATSFSIGDASTVPIRGEPLSPQPNLAQIDQSDDLFGGKVENAFKSVVVNECHSKIPYSNYSNDHCNAEKEIAKSKETIITDVTDDKLITNVTDDKTNNYSKHNEITVPMPISDKQVSSGDSSHTNENVFNDDEADTNEATCEENQSLQEDLDLREFDVLDEFEGSVSDKEEGELIESNSGESDLEFDEDGELPIDDIDEMLEESLPEHLKRNKECPVKLRKKIVLEEIGHDHFDLLPEGWIQIMHSSGMPVYLHQKSRVCTMARPYYLGPGSTRNHKIPLSAIPCLQYRRASELEKKNKEEIEKKKQAQINQTQSEIELMSAEIETFEENEATQSLEATDLHEYCKERFKFKTLTLIPFKTWSDRRKYVKMRREAQRKQRPTLPGGTKLLKFPIKNPDGSASKSKGEWIINPNGKSYVCILHEYVQHALKKHPKYEFKELENPATPYSATVYIEDMKYGFGMGASKKHAKVEAAKAALEVLIPGMKDKIEPDNQFGIRSGTTKRSSENDVSIFDQIKVEDPRVAEFCAKSTEPPPYAILMTCLSRNTGVGEIELSYEMSPKSFRQDEFTMTVGNHKATVACKNKREGKQRAAQAILKALHPNITYWGSLLRMYGNKSIKDIKEKKQEEQEITQLQSKASLNQPNYAILNKLKTEMLKLRAKKEALKAKGKFVLPQNIILPSLSSTELNKINLSSNK